MGKVLFLLPVLFLFGCSATIIQMPHSGEPPRVGIIECSNRPSCSDAKDKMKELCGNYEPEIVNMNTENGIAPNYFSGMAPGSPKFINTRHYVFYFLCVKR